MRKSTLIIVMCAISLGAFVSPWRHQTKPAEQVKIAPLDPTRVVFDTNSLTVRNRPLPPQLPPLRTVEQPLEGLTPIHARETLPVQMHAEEILLAFTMEVCACPTMACLIEVNDHYMSKVTIAAEGDRGHPEIEELWRGAQECLEAGRAEEQPPPASREELIQQREIERRVIMRGASEGGG